MSQEQVVITEKPAPNPVRVVLIVVGALAVLGLLWLVVISPLLASDEDLPPIQSQGAQQTPSPDAAATGGTEPDAAATVQDLPTETFAVYLARDPFQPLISGVDSGGTTGGTDGGTTAGGTTDGTATGGTDGGTTTAGTTTGGTDGGTTTAGTTTGSGCVDRGETVCDGRVVTLVDVFTEDGVAQAIIQVDSTLYTVRAGDLFASNFRVLEIIPPCVTLLYGDDRFTLCEGDQVLK